MNVGDLNVIVCDEEGNWNELPITESPYYKSLINDDPTIFYEYHKLLRQYSEYYDQELNWEEFNDLAESIEVNGIDEEKMKTIEIKDGTVLDGQHRISILHALHGPNYNISQWVE